MNKIVRCLIDILDIECWGAGSVGKPVQIYNCYLQRFAMFVNTYSDRKTSFNFVFQSFDLEDVDKIFARPSTGPAKL